MKKRGLSEVVSSILLVAIVISISVFVFSFSKNLVGTPTVDDSGKNIELVCQQDIDFSASYSGGTIQIVNRGKSIINNFDLIVYYETDSETISLKDYFSDEWPEEGLGISKGISLPFILNENQSKANEFLFIAYVEGEKNGEKILFNCGEAYGSKIDVSLGICGDGSVPKIVWTTNLEATNENYVVRDNPSINSLNGKAFSEGRYFAEVSDGAWSRWNEDDHPQSPSPGKTWQTSFHIMTSESYQSVSYSPLLKSTEQEAIESGKGERSNVLDHTSGEISIYLEDYPIDDNRGTLTINLYVCSQ